MDINFQFGEFTGENDSIIKDLISAIISVAAIYFPIKYSLKLFNEGLRQQKLSEVESKNELQKEKVLYFASLIENVNLTVNKFIEGAKEADKNLQNNPVGFPEVKLTTIYDLERLVTKINQEEYYLAYLNQIGGNNRKEASEQFIKLYASLEHFLGTAKSMMQTIEIFARNYDHPRKVEFATMQANIANDVAKLLILLRSENNPSNNRLIVGLDTLLVARTKFIEAQKTNLIGIKDVFLKPLIDILIPRRQNPQIYELCLRAANANQLLTSVMNGIEDHRKDLRHFSEQLEGTMKIFQEVSEPIRLYKEQVILR